MSSLDRFYSPTYRGPHSCLYVQRRRDLTDALSITPSYLRNDFSSSGLVTDYRDWQIPLGRRFRSLKIWFVMRSYGTAAMKAHIRNHIELGKLFHSLALSRPDLFKVVTPPAFAVTVLTVLPPRQEGDSIAAHDLTKAAVTDGLEKSYATPQAEDTKLARMNEITKEVYEQVISKGQIYLTSGVVNGIYAIRVVSANPKTEEKYIRRAFDIIVENAEDVLAQHGQQ